MRAIQRVTASLSIVVLVAAGCGSAASPSLVSTTPTTPPPATPSPVASPSVVPTPAATATGPSPLVGGPVSPGSYRSTSTGTTIDFAIGEAGWEAADDIPEVGFALIRRGIEGGLTVTRFPGEVFSEPCSPEAQEPIEASASGFIGWLAAHPELEASGEPVETTLGGQPALQLDVSAAVGEECPERPRIWLWVLPTVGDFHLDEGEAARFIAADVGDTTVVVVIETFDPSQQAALLEATEPLLESMTVVP